MIIDSNNAFSNPQALTASAVSTNIIDLGVARDLGIGDNDLQLAIIGDGLFASADGTATLNIQFQGAPDNGSGAPGSYTTYAESGAMTITQLNSGGLGAALWGGDSIPSRLVAGAEGQGTAMPRFLRLDYIVGTESFTAGTITYAGLVLNREKPTQYPSGFTVAN